MLLDICSTNLQRSAFCNAGHVGGSAKVDPSKAKEDRHRQTFKEIYDDLRKYDDEIWWNMMKYDEIWWNMMKYDEIWWNMMKYDEIYGPYG